MDNGLILLDKVRQCALREEVPSLEDLLYVFETPLANMVEAAHEVTVSKANSVFNFCAIVNAKSGRCSENCHWCAQSRHFSGQCNVYPLLEEEKILQAALAAQRSGATRFSLVTSGRKLSRREVRETAEIVQRLKRETSLEICVSAGLLAKEEFQLLAQAGVCRCHCNLEASESYFPRVCTSHTILDKLKTIEAARNAGLEVCSGGIIGLGENRQNRIELALTLRKLEIPSIPINILEPIKGTPLEHVPPISEEEIVRTIAMFRLVNPKAYLRFAGGRRRLSESATQLAFRAGINSAIAGDMLTTKGIGIEKDKLLVKKCGYRLEQNY